jgi:hypothetical protein
MKVMGIMSNIFTKRFEAGGVKMAKKDPAPAIDNGIFDKVEDAKSEFWGLKNVENEYL